MIVFFSDNGAIKSWSEQPKNYEGRFGPYPVLGDNGPLRVWIGELYDGCVRTPALVNWPPVLKPGVVEHVTSVLDWYPTLLVLAEGKVRDEWRLEGRNIWPLLNGTGKVPNKVLYWKSYGGHRAAVRHGDWKLHVDYRSGENELFNMREDPSEKQNLIVDQPGRVRELTALLRQQAKLDGE